MTELEQHLIASLERLETRVTDKMDATAFELMVLKSRIADMEQHAEYSSVGYECIEPDISAETTATDAAESTAASETTDAAESTATAETAAEQSGYSAEGREK